VSALVDAPSASARRADAVADKPTHVVISPADVFAKAGHQGVVIAKLPPGTQVRLVETKDG
jgi:hypothetical protein